MHVDRRELADVFRQRLRELIQQSGLSQSAYAARVGMDRATLSQLLAAESVRLPRAETIAAIAADAHVSVDWLLGLSQEGQLATDIFSEALEIEAAADSPDDARLQQWHKEATGYKIRYVPTTLPDFMKSESVIRHEFRAYTTFRPEGRIELAEARLAYNRRPETDMEICSSVQALEDFAQGLGIWKNLSPEDRRSGLDTMIQLLDELYPTVRWFLFDGLQRYSVPLTIFGPKRAAIYIGDMYFVFNSTEHIRVLTEHFDNLIRAAVLQPPDVMRLLQSLRDEVCAANDNN